MKSLQFFPFFCHIYKKVKKRRHGLFERSNQIMYFNMMGKINGNMMRLAIFHFISPVIKLKEAQDDGKDDLSAELMQKTKIFEQNT